MGFEILDTINGPNVDDRVMDVLGKLLAKFRSNLVVGPS
jgi:hypothetical protein